MRTGLFLIAGFLMLAAALLLGRLFSANYPGATVVATVVYVALWFVIAAANMRVGVARAGAFARSATTTALSRGSDRSV